MKLRTTLKIISASLLIMICAPLSLAGVSPGTLMVSQCETDLSTLSDDFDDSASLFASDVIAKLNQMDDAGRSDTQITVYAQRQINKLRNAEDRTLNRANKLTNKCFHRLIDFDEPDMITQITDVDADRDAAVIAIEMDADDAETMIQNALDMIVP